MKHLNKDARIDVSRKKKRYTYANDCIRLTEDWNVTDLNLNYLELFLSSIIVNFLFTSVSDLTSL